MPRFSIVMPTYNRADTILRAIESVRAQGFSDWELIVVDDGSTDGTAERLAGLDPRLRVIRQENRGVTAARNAGLAAVTGQLIGFLDSDDEWLPHHLALAAAFFEAFPGEHLYTSEFWADYGGASKLNYFAAEMGEWAPRTAARIGSKAFAKPAPQGEPYLWFFETAEPLGAWAEPALRGTPYREARLFRGQIFSGWRWEFLMSMQSTVLTRHALDQVGRMDERIRVASDYAWLALLCKAFRANLISAPGCIKHEYVKGKELPSEGHLVTGKTAIRFHQDMLEIFEDLFMQHAPEDRELQGIRDYRHFKVGEAALLQGDRTLALEHLNLAGRTYQAREVQVARWLARLAGNGGVARRLYAGLLKLEGLPARVYRKLVRTLQAAPTGRAA
jgi:glycosyltransferase involved in cell wall biosynthesis